MQLESPWDLRLPVRECSDVKVLTQSSPWKSWWMSMGLREENARVGSKVACHLFPLACCQTLGVVLSLKPHSSHFPYFPVPLLFSFSSPFSFLSSHSPPCPLFFPYAFPILFFLLFSGTSPISLFFPAVVVQFSTRNNITPSNFIDLLVYFF